MSELTKEGLLRLRREEVNGKGDEAVLRAIDMALRTHDAEAECESLRGSLNAAVELHGDCEERCRTLEAECERLRDALNDHHQWARKHGHEMGLGYLNSWLDGKTRKALATPPSSGEPEKCPECGGRGLVSAVDWVEDHPFLAAEPCPRCSDDAPHTPERADYLVEQIKSMPEWAADKIRGLMRGEDAAVSRHTEQAHGDALADEPARLVRMAFQEGVDAENVETAWDFSDAVVQADILKERIEALTASGVSEEVRRLPEKWRESAQELKRIDSWSSQPAITKNRCADELEQALVSAPADGYKMVPVEPTPKMVDATWDHDEDETESHNTRNHRIWSAMIAAAPTDGREND